MSILNRGWEILNYTPIIRNETDAANNINFIRFCLSGSAIISFIIGIFVFLFFSRMIGLGVAGYASFVTILYVIVAKYPRYAQHCLRLFILSAVLTQFVELYFKHTQIIWLYNIPVVSFYLFEKKEALIWSGVTGTIKIGFLLLNQYYLHWQTMDTEMLFNFLSAYIVLVFISYIMNYSREVSQYRMYVANENLKAAKVEAEKATHMKSRFLAQMTHDLRTPLHVVNGSLDLLTKESAIQANTYLDNLVNLALKSGERQLRLVNSILDLSKIEAGKMEFNLDFFLFSDLLTGIPHQMGILLRGKSVEFLLDNQVQDDRLVIRADKTRLEQVLTNLLSNAVKYTENGRITLALRLDRTTDRIHFSVSDSGVGLSQEDGAKVFQEYVRLENKLQTSVTGTGLGLAISKAFIEAHQGDITMTSVLGKGTIFNFWIPLIEGQLSEQATAAHLAHIDYDLLRTKRILLVDDDEFNRDFIAMVFMDRIDYQLVNSGKRALECVAQESYDLVLTDYNMPGMNGRELLIELRKHDPNLPVIVVTAAAMKGTREELLSYGFDGYFTKPFRGEEILAYLSGFFNQYSTGRREVGLALPR